MAIDDMLHLKDEDFEKEFNAEFNKLISASKQEEQEEEDHNVTDEVNTDEEESQEDGESTESNKSESSEEESSEENSVEENESSEQESEGENESTDEAQKEEKEKTETQPIINYEEEYKKLLAPFKANGSEMKVNNIEEAITLMQKGANYHQKMNSIKPIMRIAKMLENNNLLNENDIQFLIDVKKHDPSAIAKLISDAKIDPVTIDPDQRQEYKPGNDRVTDSDMMFDEVMADIKESPAFSKTIKAIEQFDSKSQLALAQDPELIRKLNYQVEIGLFDKVNSELTRRQVLGLVPKNLSVFEAYMQVGDDLYKAGALKEFDDKVITPNVAKPDAKPTGKKAPLKNVDNDSLKAKKQSVAPTVGTTAKQKDLKDFNPLSMTDDEFEAQYGKALR